MYYSYILRFGNLKALRSFAVQELLILQNVSHQTNNFWGRRTDESSEVYSIHCIGRSCSDLPFIFQFLQMQERKNNSKGGNKVTATRKAKATTQPDHSIEVTTEWHKKQLFNLLDKYFQSHGIGATESTSFLVGNFFSPNTNGAAAWTKDYVCDVLFDINNLNLFISNLHNAWAIKNNYEALHGISK